MTEQDKFLYRCTASCCCCCSCLKIYVKLISPRFSSLIFSTPKMGLYCLTPVLLYLFIRRVGDAPLTPYPQRTTFFLLIFSYFLLLCEGWVRRLYKQSKHYTVLPVGEHKNTLRSLQLFNSNLKLLSRCQSSQKKERRKQARNVGLFTGKCESPRRKGLTSERKFGQWLSEALIHARSFGEDRRVTFVQVGCVLPCYSAYQV